MQLRGSESAPAKANEASQKNDIGAAKDDISLAVVNAKMQGMENAYVENGVSKSEALTTVGQTVINSVLEKNGTNIGKATIDVEQTEENGVKGNASISISTTDFVVYGIITVEDGILTWGEIEENKPEIKLDLYSLLTITKGKEREITAILKQIPADTELTWTSNKTAKVTVTPIANTKKAKIKGIEKTDTDTNEKVTISVTAGEYSATIEVVVIEEPPFILGEPATGTVENYGKKVIDYKSNVERVQDEIGWRLFYQDTEGNSYLIADKLVGDYTPSNEWGSHTGATTSAIGKGLNPLVTDLMINNSSYGNLSQTSWMTDPEVWSIYTDSEVTGKNKAIFAIGSPTIELYTKSYNAVAEINSSVNEIAFPTKGKYGYTYSSMPSGLTTAVGGIYNKGTGTVWWFASPGWSNVNSNYCFRMCNSSLDGGMTNYSHPIRPIVCIPTFDFNTAYHLES